MKITDRVSTTDMGNIVIPRSSQNQRTKYSEKLSAAKARGQKASQCDPDLDGGQKSRLAPPPSLAAWGPACPPPPPTCAAYWQFREITATSVASKKGIYHDQYHLEQQLERYGSSNQFLLCFFRLC